MICPATSKSDCPYGCQVVCRKAKAVPGVRDKHSGGKVLERTNPASGEERGSWSHKSENVSKPRRGRSIERHGDARGPR